MSSRSASWLAWSLAALSLIMFAASVALYLATLPVQPPSSWGTGGISAVLYVYLPFLAFPLVGALIASNRPKNPIGWICLAVGIICVMVPFQTENWLHFSALLHDGAPEARFERAVPG